MTFGKYAGFTLGHVYENDCEFDSDEKIIQPGLARLAISSASREVREAMMDRGCQAVGQAVGEGPPKGRRQRDVCWRLAGEHLSTEHLPQSGRAASISRRY